MSSNPDRQSRLFKAVILDYGCVLSLPPTPESIRTFAATFQVEPAKFFDSYYLSRGPYDQGLLSAEEYWANFARSLNVPIDARLIAQLRSLDIEIWSRINVEMTAWLGELYRAGLVTALLSNMPPDMAHHVRRSFPWMEYFHHPVFSCELGCIKPDPTIFRKCLERINVRPKEALFADDRKENAAAAKALGIVAIRFESVPQLCERLGDLRFPVLPRSNRCDRSWPPDAGRK
ncbi:MAG TPA: HAD family phosphatase [Terriglobales bacterium]|nr:HAD family phosphatase [Terriglobales bacterium]